MSSVLSHSVQNWLTIPQDNTLVRILLTDTFPTDTFTSSMFPKSIHETMYTYTSFEDVSTPIDFWEGIPDWWSPLLLTKLPSWCGFAPATRPCYTSLPFISGRFARATPTSMVVKICESYTDLYGGHLKWLTLPFLPWSRLIMGTFIKSFLTYPRGLIEINQDFHWNLGLSSAGRNLNESLRRSCRPYIHAIMFRRSKKSYTPLWDTLVSTKT